MQGEGAVDHLKGGNVDDRTLSRQSPFYSTGILKNQDGNDMYSKYCTELYSKDILYFA